MYKPGQAGRSNPKYIAKEVCLKAYKVLCSEDTELSRDMDKLTCFVCCSADSAAKLFILRKQDISLCRGRLVVG